MYLHLFLKALPMWRGSVGEWRAGLEISSVEIHLEALALGWLENNLLLAGKVVHGVQGR